MVCVPPFNFGQEKCDLGLLDEDCDRFGQPRRSFFNLRWRRMGVFWARRNFKYSVNVDQGIENVENGEEILFGMRTPIAEICGNLDDDDCDRI